eukprot:PRCOL_00000717-RA
MPAKETKARVTGHKRPAEVVAGHDPRGPASESAEDAQIVAPTTVADRKLSRGAVGGAPKAQLVVPQTFPQTFPLAVNHGLRDEAARHAGHLLEWHRPFAAQRHLHGLPSRGAVPERLHCLWLGLAVDAVWLHTHAAQCDFVPPKVRASHKAGGHGCVHGGEFERATVEPVHFGLGARYADGERSLPPSPRMDIGTAGGLLRPPFGPADAIARLWTAQAVWFEKCLADGPRPGPHVHRVTLAATIKRSSILGNAATVRAQDACAADGGREAALATAVLAR